jgi:hypothetical protein
MRRWILILAGLALALGWTSTARAASHLWRFHEVFSSADGTIQFIEMQECCGATAEHELNAKWILAVGTDTMFTFRKSLTGNTANKYLLLATQGFADLPGAPAPDFIIPEGFLPLDGETLEYWMYSDATWSYTAGQIPVDGVTSLNVDGTTGVNSPTNYAGVSSSVVAVEPATWGMLKIRMW